MELEVIDRLPQISACLSPVFRLGPIEVDRHLHQYLRLNEVDLDALLQRHACGDWGSFDPSNDRWLPPDHPHKGQLLSVFSLNGLHIEVMTEWDCSATSVRLAH